ncbi:GTPase-activating protein SAC7 [Cytospora mali]|uniref:GTPase-activating protein SAC7 n=1 Tax=Cytospora mali TaxID=578113 RepID=A0A194W6K2_CYTMA|nr:GTPase-activating protein SAC7 [Valsa mali]
MAVLPADMDWVPISTGCFSACNAISKTSPALRSFIREVREARTELDAVLAELHSLDGVLDILKDDASSFPGDLAQRTAPLLEHCSSIVHQIEGYMHVCNGLGLSPRDKKFRWMAIRGDMEKLRLTLEGYKSTLAVVTDLVGLSKHRQEKENKVPAADTGACCYRKAVEYQDEDIKDDLARVMGDMDGLRSRLQGEFGSIYAVCDLESYLDTMEIHATNLGYRLQTKEMAVVEEEETEEENEVEEQEREQGQEQDQEQEQEEAPESPRPARTADREDHHTHSGSSSVGDAPDSAIDMYDGPPSPYGRSSKDEEGGSLVPEKKNKQPRRAETGPHGGGHRLPVVEIDEFLDVVRDIQMPDPSTPRAPTPPPKAVARSNSMISTTLSPFAGRDLPGLNRPLSAHSISDYGISEYGVLDSEGNAVVPERVSSLRSRPNSDMSNDSRSTLGSLRGIRPPPPRSDSSNVPSPRGETAPVAAPPPRRGSHYGVYMGGGTVTTTITGGSSVRESSVDEAAPPPIKDSRSRSSRTKSRLFGRKNSFSVPGLPTRPVTANNATTRPGSTGGAHVMSAFADAGDDDCSVPPPIPEARSYRSSPALPASPTIPTVSTISTTPTTPTSQGAGHVRESIETSVTNTTSSSGGKPPRPSTALSTAGASIRSSGSRISSMFKRVSLWSPKIAEEDAPAEDPEPDDIFGVSLKKSMQMASATVKTHHDGSKASSRREFPRCILTCVIFIKENGGLTAPNIFGGEMAIGGDSMVRVASLKEHFSTPPYYGEGNIDWADYTVYDAAELIVVFLQQLRKPLISETVAKRWVVLSKQATLPGSMGLRLDSCIDFWDEALLGVRGAARSLFKLLLNLLGDIADAADINDMTAERLASRLLNPLMHMSAAKYTTDYMLGLAFLIRKRSEYSALMRRDGKKSNAAFES